MIVSGRKCWGAKPKADRLDQIAVGPVAADVRGIVDERAPAARKGIPPAGRRGHDLDIKIGVAQPLESRTPLIVATLGARRRIRSREIPFEQRHRRRQQQATQQPSDCAASKNI